MLDAGTLAELGPYRRMVRFRLNGEERSAEGISPDTTLLNWLREDAVLKGTKEGCAEGDCGACTVVVARHRADGTVERVPVNACILFMPMLDGLSVTTVEGLLGPSGELHPCQQAMVTAHASQCGFCTPGFVMALYALWASGKKLTRQMINDGLAGNLCRCTGYRPILDAGLSLDETPSPAWCQARLTEEDEWLHTIKADTQMKETLLVEEGGSTLIQPGDADTFSRIYASHPEATVLAGATDIGLWVNKQHRRLPLMISIGRVAEYQRIEIRGKEITIGAGVTHHEAMQALSGYFPDLDELLRRFGSAQVRASGTVGGNIANGSPIGDLPPAFLALGAEIHLRCGAKERSRPLDGFFLDYMKKDLGGGEHVSHLSIPTLDEDEIFACHKVSKRFDQDISSVMGAARLRLKGNRVIAARLAYGGMAAIPKRAPATENALEGIDLADTEALEEAVSCLEADFAPISDMRASADYRMKVAANFIYRLAHEQVNGAVPRLASAAGW